MELSFEQGDPQKPKGHALVYFRDTLDPEKVYASYTVVLPVSVDFSKYVPPFLVSQLSGTPLKDISTFSLPPMPEEVESYQRLMKLVVMRQDDLIYGGTISLGDLPRTMDAVGEIVQRYAELWSDFVKSEAALSAATEERSLRVNEVMYSLLSEQDRLKELSKLVGKLRFAIEGQDQQMQQDGEEEIRTLGRYLPGECRVENLIEAASDASEKGTRLAQLYLDLCYKLVEGGGTAIGHLEEQIKALEGSD